MTEERFHPLFESWARRVRARLALRRALTGAAIGLAVATIPAGIAWKTRHGNLRPWAPLVGIVGLGAGLAIGARKRWSDTEVALWLDDRLATDETITTAVEMRNEAEEDDPTRAVVVTKAAAALSAGDRKRARVSLWKPVHLLAPLSVAAIVFIARAPLPPAPAAPPPPPGTTKVQIAEVEGLKHVVALGEVNPRDEAQRQRLEQLSKDAEKLKADLEKGMEKREAQDRIAKLRDAIAAERLTLGDGRERAGLEAAQSKLEESAVTKDAAKALGDHDLEKFDEEMEKLANSREEKDRELAKQKIQEAADAAKQNGAPGVAKQLEQEKQLIEERERRAGELRDLANALGDAGIQSDDIKQKSEALDREGTDEAAKKLADAMGKALDKLTPEERKRLAEKLKERAQKNGGGVDSDPQRMKDLADDLSTPEGQEKLEKELKDLANEDTESDEAKRQKALDDAEEGTDDTDKDLGKGNKGKPGDPQDGDGDGQGPGKPPPNPFGQQPGEGDQNGDGQQQPGQGQQAGNGGTPIPIPMNGEGNPQSGKGQGGDANGDQPGGGGTHDTGTGSHEGQTPELGGDTMRSRAHGHVNKAAPMPGQSSGFAAGKAGGTANTRGTGALQSAGPEQVEGVEGSDVPEEYREQVRQYFQP